MKKIIFFMIIAIILIGCETKEEAAKPKIKTKEEIVLEKLEKKKLDEQLLKEKLEKYKNMLSINRESGDIKGIWYIDQDNIKIVNNFFNIKISSTSGYCVQVSDDLKRAQIFIVAINKVYDVQLEKLSDIKYEMRYGNKIRTFEVVNLSHPLYKNSKDLIWFFEDSHKYNIKKGSEQLQDGFNFYDYCTKNTQYECTIDGCIKDILDRDDVGRAEHEAGPLGIEDEKIPKNKK